MVLDRLFDTLHTSIDSHRSKFLVFIFRYLLNISPTSLNITRQSPTNFQLPPSSINRYSRSQHACRSFDLCSLGLILVFKPSRFLSRRLGPSRDTGGVKSWRHRHSNVPCLLGCISNMSAACWGWSGWKLYLKKYFIF